MIYMKLSEETIYKEYRRLADNIDNTDDLIDVINYVLEIIDNYYNKYNKRIKESDLNPALKDLLYDLLDTYHDTLLYYALMKAGLLNEDEFDS